MFFFVFFLFQMALTTTNSIRISEMIPHTWSVVLPVMLPRAFWAAPVTASIVDLRVEVLSLVDMLGWFVGCMSASDV
jgi:hypothetical protein